ncbi:MAG: hypothetical protein RLY20_2122 [Verrucomicrobiota bacterium]|jgi:hypothetical protein
MISSITLPSELIQAAESLEQRMRILSVPTRKVPLSEWALVPEKVQDQIPVWVPALLASHSLHGAVLACQNRNDDMPSERWFSFAGPDQFKEFLLSKDYVWDTEILAQGYCPISYEQNGDLWVTSIKDGPDSPIYLFGLSEMERFFASSRIACMMSCMAISELGFNDPEKPRSVMWHP